MQNLKLILLFSALLNTFFIRSMEVGEEENPNFEEFKNDQLYMIGYNEKQEILDQESIDVYSDLTFQLAALNFPNIECNSNLRIIDNLFDILDPYEALLKSIDLIKKIHPEMEDDMYAFFQINEDLEESSQELLIFIIKQLKICSRYKARIEASYRRREPSNNSHGYFIP